MFFLYFFLFSGRGDKEEGGGKEEGRGAVMVAWFHVCYVIVL